VQGWAAADSVPAAAQVVSGSALVAEREASDSVVKSQASVTQLAPDWAEQLRARIVAPVGVRERFWPLRKWVQEQMLREYRWSVWRAETGEDWSV